MSDLIISKFNEKVKFIKSLNSKKGRQKSMNFYLEGIKVVTEVLESKAVNVKFIAYSKELLLNSSGGADVLEKVINQNKHKLYEFSKQVFESMVDTQTPQGILAVLEIQNNREIKKEKNLMVIDKVQDAGNLGTIIRSCDAFDVHQVICMSGTVDVYSQKVLRSTMGSILRENVIYIDDFKTLLDLKSDGYTIVGTVLDNNSVYIENLNFEKKYIFIMGNEANGISNQIRQICDIFLKIPMSSTAESLNVSIASSIILYEQFKNLKKNE